MELHPLTLTTKPQSPVVPLSETSLTDGVIGIDVSGITANVGTARLGNNVLGVDPAGADGGFGGLVLEAGEEE